MDKTLYFHICEMGAITVKKAKPIKPVNKRPVRNKHLTNVR